MDLPRTVAVTALVLAAALAIGHARAQDAAPPITAQGKISEREAQRRAAMAEHQRRKEDFQRRCIARPHMSVAELDYCRTAYRDLTRDLQSQQAL